MENLQDKYNLLVKKCHELLEENKELKSILYEHGIHYTSINSAKEQPYSSFAIPSLQMTLEDKIASFRSLFKGRDDVFARRWFNKTTGKGGYQPVCVNRRTNIQWKDILQSIL
ncbi:MAG: hypothetical protein LUC23_06660 [Prevotellaceae bacterium]|nr:hypothetical protein [Prevotellaceae bacterium]